MTGTTQVSSAVTVEQHLAVLDILSRYAQSLDDRRLEECASLFEPDAELIFDSTPYLGTAGIAIWMEIIRAQTPGCHLMANPVVRREEGVLKAVSDFALLKNPAGPWTVLARGRWLDTFHESEVGLTFARRDIVIYK